MRLIDKFEFKNNDGQFKNRYIFQLGNDAALQDFGCAACSTTVDEQLKLVSYVSDEENTPCFLCRAQPFGIKYAPNQPEQPKS